MISGVSKGIDYQCIWIISLIFQKKRAKYSPVLCGTVPFSQLFNIKIDPTGFCSELLEPRQLHQISLLWTLLEELHGWTSPKQIPVWMTCSGAQLLQWCWFQYLLWSSSGKWTWFIQSSSARLLMKIVARLFSIKRITWKQSTARLSDGISSINPT